MRSYKQNCAVAHALDLVGERWTLLIVRELLIGPRRYGELLDNLDGIGTNLLASRLRTLQSDGLIEKEGQGYQLTALGRGLESVIWALVRFGLTLGVEDDSDRLTRPAWDVVALRALYRAGDDGLSGRSLLLLNGHSFCVEKIGADVRVIQGECLEANLRVELSKPTARALASGETRLADAIEDGAVVIRGSRRQAKYLLRAFGVVP